MEKVKVEIELPKESAELGAAVAKILVATKQALDDGFQVGQDIPAIVMAAYSDVVKGVDGIAKLDDEWKEDPSGVVQAIQGPVQSAVFGFFKKG